MAVDGEMLLAVGDLVDEAHRRTKARNPNIKSGPENSTGEKSPVLISRREHVVLGDSGGGRSYKTRARFGGREREISIDLGAREKEREMGMWLGVDGKKVLQIRRIGWKFRGSERVEVEGGARIQVSWDLHNWLFHPKDDDGGGGRAGNSSEFGHAVFVFRFEGEEGYFGKKGGDGEVRGVCYKGMTWGYFGKKGSNWSESSSGGRGERRRKKSLLKTRSSSSSSSSSSSGSSTVMEWASPEEAELRSAEGFSLLVYAWKS